MDLKNMGALVGGLVVSVILLAAVLVPVISEATETEKTFTNEGIINLNYVDDTYEETITWDYTKPAKLTIGTDEIDLPTSSSFAVTILGDDSFYLRWFYGNGSNSMVQLYRTSTSSTYDAKVTSSTSMTVTIANGTITFDNGSATTPSVTYENMYCICAGAGDYVMKSGTTDAYLAKDSAVFAHGNSYVSAASLTFNVTISGTPEDGFTRVIWPDTAPVSADDLVSDLQPVEGYVGLYTLNKFTFGVTNTNTSATGSTTYSQFIVPSSVTVELSQHMSSTEISLIELVPLLVTVGIIIGIIGMAFSRRE